MCLMTLLCILHMCIYFVFLSPFVDDILHFYIFVIEQVNIHKNPRLYTENNTIEHYWKPITLSAKGGVAY